MTEYEYTPEFENEEWRDAYGFEGLYLVSNMGRIKRSRTLKTSPSGRFSKFGTHPAGYQTVSLLKDGVRTKKTVHGIVANSFLGERPEGMFVNHINGIKDDNRLENLEYVTPAQNTWHFYEVISPPKE